VAVVIIPARADGKPIHVTAPTAKGLTEQKNFLGDGRAELFYSRFCRSALAPRRGDKRTVNVDSLPIFVTRQTCGQKGRLRS